MKVVSPDPNWDNDKKVRFLWLQVFDQLPRPLRDWINDDSQSIPTNLDIIAYVWNLNNQLGLYAALHWLRTSSRTAQIHYRNDIGVNASGYTAEGYRVF